MPDWKISVLVALGAWLLASCASTGSVSESQFRSVPSVDLCDMRGDANRHVGSYVRVEAVYYTNFDSETYLYAAGCPSFKLDVRNPRLPVDGGVTLQGFWNDQAAECSSLPGQNCPIGYRIRALIVVLSSEEGRHGVHLIEVFSWVRKE